MPADARPDGSRKRSRARTAFVIVLSVLLVLALASGAVVGLDRAGRLPAALRPGDLLGEPSSTPTPTPQLPRASPAPAVLEPASSTGGATLPASRLRAALRRPELGSGVGAVVADATTGLTLFGVRPTAARTPASVAKLVTAATALQVLGPDHRLTTRVVAAGAGGSDELVLVGGGDATLTRRRPDPASYPPVASLAVLADRTAAALRTAGRSGVPVRLRVDDSLFGGPSVSPAWPASYVASGVVSRVSSLSVDAGRVRPGSDVRVPDPALAAGRDFARLLAARGVAVNGGIARTTAAANARTLAAVASPTLAELVGMDLAASDNDLAETLLRVAAVGDGRPGTFTAGTATAARVLGELGVSTEGLRLLDGSGLARASRIGPRTVAELLVVACGAGHPRLRPVVSGLPVAAYSGTLASRFDHPSERDAAGLVRAKTGTLTGVSALAGVVETGGRTLVFVAMADRVPPAGTVAARDALDRFAAALVAT